MFSSLMVGGWVVVVTAEDTQANKLEVWAVQFSETAVLTVI